MEFDRIVTLDVLSSEPHSASRYSQDRFTEFPAAQPAIHGCQQPKVLTVLTAPCSKRDRRQKALEAELRKCDWDTTAARLSAAEAGQGSSEKSHKYSEDELVHSRSPVGERVRNVACCSAAVRSKPIGRCSDD